MRAVAPDPAKEHSVTEPIAAPAVPLTYVYVVGTSDYRPVKIGKANSVQDRLRSLQTGSPHQLEVRLSVQAPAVLETDLHAYFAAFRIRGEWFDFGQRDPITEVCAGIAAISRGETAGPSGPPRIRSFDHRALAKHPEYFTVSRAIDTFAKRDLGNITRIQWLDAIRTIAEALTYSSLCRKCRDTGTYDSFMPPVLAEVEGEQVRAWYFCAICRNEWPAWYSTSIEDWTT
jgi:hypothetical protein